MLVVRNINGRQIAVETSKSSSIYLRESDLKESGIDALDCNLYSIELFLKGSTDIVPFELTWELTNNCNLNCPFCYIHNHVHCKDISFEIAKPYIDEMILNGLFRVTLTGGECTLNKDFLTIYRYFKENGVLVDVYTNGVVINPSIFETFEKLPPNRIEMTIYNSYANDPRPYHNALEFQKRGFNVLIKFTLTKTTIPYFNFVKTWCGEHNFSFKFDTDIFDAYDNSNTNAYQIDIEDKIRFDRLRAKNVFPKREMLCFSCGAGNVSYHINSKFELGLCCKDCNRFSLLDTSFTEAYAKMKSLIMEFKNKAYSNCNNCFARPICRMCYLRCIKSTDEHGNTTLTVPESFCKATQEYYKKLFSN